VDTSGITNGDILKWNGSSWSIAADDTGTGGGSTYWSQSGTNLYLNKVGMWVSEPRFLPRNWRWRVIQK